MAAEAATTGPRSVPATSFTRSGAVTSGAGSAGMDDAPNTSLSSNADTEAARARAPNDLSTSDSGRHRGVESHLRHDARERFA